MIEFLSTYGIYIGGAVLAAFLKPTNDKPIWKIALDAVVRPTAPATPGTPQEIVSLLLKRLADKQPIAEPAKPSEPAKPDAPKDVVTQIIELLTQTETAIDGDHATIDEDMAHLVSCSQAVSAKYPDHDITVAIVNGDVQVSKVKRAEQK